MDMFSFGDFPVEYSGYHNSRAVIFPVPYEKTTTYGQGCFRGPEAIIAASRQLEFYDEVLNAEPYRIGIHTAEAFCASPPPEKLPEELRRAAGKYLKDGKLLVGLGGEHSVSLGLVMAAREEFENLAVLHIDAHADMRDSYEGTRFGHGCVLRRISEYCPVFLYGIRSLSVEERGFIDSNEIPTVYAFERNKTDKCRELVEKLPENIYLSIDIDACDPSLAPGVGTPEPGGLFWDELMDFLNRVNEKSNIVGFDVVEVMPIPGQVVSEFVAAKLVYRLLGMIGEKRGWL
jgi:agmatinase